MTRRLAILTKVLFWLGTLGGVAFVVAGIYRPDAFAVALGLFTGALAQAGMWSLKRDLNRNRFTQQHD
jgi:hypothetical protein